VQGFQHLHELFGAELGQVELVGEPVDDVTGTGSVLPRFKGTGEAETFSPSSR
jgi:hypothetical protein